MVAFIDTEADDHSLPERGAISTTVCETVVYPQSGTSLTRYMICDKYDTTSESCESIHSVVAHFLHNMPQVSYRKTNVKARGLKSLTF